MTLALDKIYFIIISSRYCWKMESFKCFQVISMTVNFMVEKLYDGSPLKINCFLVSGLHLFWVSLSKCQMLFQVLFHMVKVSSSVGTSYESRYHGRDRTVTQSLMEFPNPNPSENFVFRTLLAVILSRTWCGAIHSFNGSTSYKCLYICGNITVWL